MNPQKTSSWSGLFFSRILQKRESGMISVQLFFFDLEDLRFVNSHWQVIYGDTWLVRTA